MDEALLTAIREAFPDGEPPARPITGHRCVECDDIDHLIGGRAWPEVAARPPEPLYDAYTFLTPAAQRYYLPAFLSLAVRDPEYLRCSSIAAAAGGYGAFPEVDDPLQQGVMSRWVEWASRDSG